jgi:uncharacterized protein YbjT (DUF2867 family)
MILVTGAAGKTGRAVIRGCAEAGMEVRALIRKEEQAPRVRALGAIEAVCADFQDLATLERAAQGVDAIYHIPPNVSPHEFAFGERMVAAARTARVRRFVYHSVLHPQIEAMPHHWEKMRVEEHLLASGLEFTILQPAVYMQNVTAQWDAVAEHGRYTVPYALATRLSMVDLQDVASAAGVVLGDEGHAGATYELTGSEPLSQVEIAAILSAGVGHPVTASAIPLEDWEKQARGAGLGAYQVKALRKMFQYYERYNLIGNPRTLTWLLGRSPGSLHEVIERERARRTQPG